MKAYVRASHASLGSGAGARAVEQAREVEEFVADPERVSRAVPRPSAADFIAVRLRVLQQGFGLLGNISRGWR